MPRGGQVNGDGFYLKTVRRTDWQGEAYKLYSTERINVAKWNQAFDNNTVWQMAGTVPTPNAIAAPDGTLTCDKISEDGTIDLHYFQQVMDIVTSGKITSQMVIKSGGIASINISLNSWPGATRVSNVIFNLETGLFSVPSAYGGASGLSYSAVALGSGFWLITKSVSLGGPETECLVQYILDIDKGANHQGIPANGIYIWNFDLKVGDPTSIIGPTGAAPVALTDYTLGANGILTLNG